MKNPLTTASGTSGYAFEYGDFVDLRLLGAFVTKSITLHPRKGNAPPRIIETRAGMLNAIGLANVGLEAFVAEKVPQLREMGLPVFVNVAGTAIDDYCQVARRLNEVDVVRGLELNISCPNVKEGGISFGTDCGQVAGITSAIRAAAPDKVLVVKLSPNVTDIAATAAAAVDAGADALSLVNTFTAMAVDVDRRRPMLSNGNGGLSGPAIRPIAVYMVHRVYSQVARKHNIPIMGMGGIQTARDALEFLIAGATALSVGTALFVDPTAPVKILDGLADYCRRHNLSALREVIGSLQFPEPGKGYKSTYA
ncbi:MAG: Dihydroorotate dehydrogenase B (NAD(+)), catalytic subunit [Phycisphaerae bacterium]|nr:Dihydroorotate dehydrogenase B (NAD(+)), catalytic subunit [Phycisphaerae bacterium]